MKKQKMRCRTCRQVLVKRDDDLQYVLSHQERKHPDETVIIFEPV